MKPHLTLLILSLISLILLAIYLIASRGLINNELTFQNSPLRISSTTDSELRNIAKLPNDGERIYTFRISINKSV